MAPGDLSQGMSGAEVLAIQKALNVQIGLPGPTLSENGIFDSAMAERLTQFQTLKRIRVTGIVDDATRLAMFPFGVATVTILATRLTLPSLAAPAISARYPHFANQMLTPPSWALPRLGSSWEPLPQFRYGPRSDAHADLRDHVGWSDPTRLSIDWSLYAHKFRLDVADAPAKQIFEPVRIPGALVDLMVDQPVDIPSFTPTPITRGPFHVLGFDFNHVEVVPGGQSTFNLRQARQDALTLTMQMIYQRGPDDKANQTITTGVQIGAPIVANFPNGAPWTFNPFVQFTDVDRFGKLGFFHWWQPYAQIGAQVQGPGDLHPTINGGLFPLNLGFDIGNFVTMQLNAGVPFAFDFQTRTATLGAQAGFGFALKLGDFWPVARWGQQ
jgi:Putative peptidoglycan binding domain